MGLGRFATEQGGPGVIPGVLARISTYHGHALSLLEGAKRTAGLPEHIQLTARGAPMSAYRTTEGLA
jgi:hypothetical protein